MTRTLFSSVVLVVLLAGCAAKDGKDGAPGPAGELGPRGATGVQGATGPQGIAGPAGATGVAGATGAAGAAGANGAAGATGPAGATGAAGAAGAAGPSGVVTIENILVENPFSTVPANSDRAWFGNTVILTTTATQRLTGVVTASASANVQVGINYALCLRAQGATTAPLIFTTPMSATVTASGVTTFTAASSASPGAGSWQVGMCASNNTATVVTGGSQGWIMVTN